MKLFKTILRWIIYSLVAAFLLWGVYVAIILGSVPTKNLNEVAHAHFGSRGFVAVISSLAFYPGMFVIVIGVVYLIYKLIVSLEKIYNWLFKTD